jgi:hypothetical protein
MNGTEEPRSDPHREPLRASEPASANPPVPAGSSPEDLPRDERRSNERRSGDRRSRPTPFLSRYTFFGGRRASDRRYGHVANTYVDRYEPWVGGVLVAIGLLCALDAVLTLLYLQKGGEEANPIMDEVIQWGPQTFVLVKCGVTNAGLMILCLHKNFRYVKGVMGALLGIYALLTLYHLWLASVFR